MESDEIIIKKEEVNKVIEPTHTEEPVIKIDNVDYKLDKEGNALDDKGQVFKSKADIEALSSVDNSNVDNQIKIDDVIYKLDDKGNAVDDKGKVFKTASEIDELSKNNEPTSIDFEGIKKVVNYIPIDDKGKPIEYESTPEGVAKYVKDTATQLAKQFNAKQADDFFKKNPDIYSIYQYKQARGTVDGYNNLVDYRKFTIDENDEESLVSAITTARIQRGDTKASIDTYVGYLKDSKKLVDEAKIEKAWLDKQSETQFKQIADEALANKAKEELANTTFWNEVKDKVVAKKELKLGDKTYKIPEVIRVKVEDGKVLTRTVDDFYEYLSKPLQYEANGNVVEMSAYENDLAAKAKSHTVDNDLYEAFLMFVKGDASQFIEQNIRQAHVNRVREIFTDSKKSKGNVTSISTGGKKAVKFDV
jgi:hypothetical protein